MVDEGGTYYLLSSSKTWRTETARFLIWDRSTLSRQSPGLIAVVLSLHMTIQFNMRPAQAINRHPDGAHSVDEVEDSATLTKGLISNRFELVELTR